MIKELSVNSDQRFDVIGDIHGFVDPLVRLLKTLGYKRERGCFRHPQRRRVIFLGDYIDRGPAIRETLHLVRDMVDSGEALALLGNHEYNAVCFHTPDGNGDFLRSHFERAGKNVEQHRATLEAFAGIDDEWSDWISWFKSLPLALIDREIRAVHAAWSAADIEFLRDKSLGDDAFLSSSASAETAEFEAIETVLKGIELSLPPGNFISDGQGFERSKIRVRWWEEPRGKSFREVVFPDCDMVSDQPVEFGKNGAWKNYPAREAPVFFGHYWLPVGADPRPVAPNAACLDYSVTRSGGKLAAYRWDGEQSLKPDKFVTVPA